MNVGIYIYDNAEVLDFSGPFEVFSTASRLSGPEAAFSVFLVAEQKRPVVARGDYQVNPHYGFDDHPPIDVLVVVGGVHHGELQKPSVIRWVSEVAAGAGVAASVCTGAFILAEAGLLAGLRVTTHWEDVDDLRAAYPSLSVVEGCRWVDEGRIVTSAGISAGIDMSLHLVSRLAGLPLAQHTARQMDFDWRRNSS